MSEPPIGMNVLVFLQISYFSSGWEQMWRIKFLSHNLSFIQTIFCMKHQLCSKIFLWGKSLFNKDWEDKTFSKLVGHPEMWKTLDLISRTYWWPILAWDGKNFSSMNKKTLLPILDSLWSMDTNFYGHHQRTFYHFCLYSHLSGHQPLFKNGTFYSIKHIFCLHWLPKHIVSDRDPGYLWKISKLLPLSISFSKS